LLGPIKAGQDLVKLARKRCSRPQASSDLCVVAKLDSYGRAIELRSVGAAQDVEIVGVSRERALRVSVKVPQHIVLANGVSNGLARDKADVARWLKACGN
jgi:hypothetical protein